MVFDTPGPVVVDIDMPEGRARIRASERGDTLVEVRPSDLDDESSVRSAEETIVEFVDGVVRIRSPRLTGLARWWGSASVDVDVAVPSGSALRAVVASGELRCHGRLGDGRITVHDGDLMLDDVGKLQLTSGDGDVSVGRVCGAAEINAGSGDVRIDRIDGAARIEGGDGEIRIGEVAGDLRIGGANTEIRVDRALADVDVRTEDGGVRLREVVRGAVAATTASGDLEIGVRKGTAAKLDVSSGYGETHLAIADIDGPQEFAETMAITARSGYGDITIQRA